MNKRVVITGCGVISSIGNSCEEVLRSLKNNASGIEYVPAYSKHGFDTQVAGTIKLPDLNELRSDFGPKARFMGVSALHSLLAAEQAIADSGIDKEALVSDRVGVLAGSSFSNAEPYSDAASMLNAKGEKTSPFDIARALTNTIAANFSYYYGMKGRCYSIGSACATSLHNIGHGYELIQRGELDMILAGGAEEVTTEITAMFNGMRRAMSKRYNSTPHTASRPYDKSRDGFVISGGAGIVILEEYSQAVARGAPIYGEIVGFGATADGYDIIKPDPTGTGCFNCMSAALQDSGLSKSQIDYVNTHGTSTPLGDVVEAGSIRRLFAEHPVRISSTKSLTGHGIGAAGVNELIYSLLMMKEGFCVASSNIEEIDDEVSDLNILRENVTCDLNHFLTNSFGFGGTNGSLVVSKVS